MELKKSDMLLILLVKNGLSHYLTNLLLDMFNELGHEVYIVRGLFVGGVVMVVIVVVVVSLNRLSISTILRIVGQYKKQVELHLLYSVSISMDPNSPEKYLDQ